jgi:sigma-B regulation protein RsbU (phosphoserine phosphatase)
MNDNVLKKELLQLRREKLAFQTQNQLLESFVTLVRSPPRAGLLRKILQKTVDISEELTGAERGSLLLIDKKGAVTDFFLTRKSDSTQNTSKIIGTVMNKGLAGWVLKHQEVGLIEDTLTDERWIDLPDQPYKARSVLGIPILKSGDLFGILTLMHSQPAIFDQETVNIIVIAVSQLAVFLENAQLYAKLNRTYKSLAEAKEQIETYSKALDNELEKGRKIQQNFLPVTIPRIPNWHIAARFHPAKQVSGDFYDIFMLTQSHLGLVIADVCDKGVGAALFMGLFRSLIRIFAGRAIPASDSLRSEFLDTGDQGPSMHLHPEKIAINAVANTNAYIEKHHSEEGIFATMFFAILEIDSGSMHYINAGHEPLFLIRSSGDIEMINTTGPAVGIMPESRFRVRKIKFRQGDTLFGYTDGVTDAASQTGERFGRERLLDSVYRSRGVPTTILQHIETDIYRYMGPPELTDDIAMIAVHRLPDKR